MALAKTLHHSSSMCVSYKFTLYDCYVIISENERQNRKYGESYNKYPSQSTVMFGGKYYILRSLFCKREVESAKELQRTVIIKKN